MAEEVGIKIEEFNTNVESLRSAVSSINSTIKTNREFEVTNIDPFKKDLKTAIDAIELLEKYKQMMNADINALENVGVEMKENDENLAKASGPQPIRA